MSKWGREGLLSRHAGHSLLGVDSRSVICCDCSVTLLFDAGREVAYRPPADNPEPLGPAAAAQGADRYGRRPCPRCGKRIERDCDGEPIAHTRLDDKYQPCVRVGTTAATLPPGGWRELVSRISGGES